MRRILVLTTALVLTLGPTAGPVRANPILFDSVATIAYMGESGGVHYYDYSLQSSSYPYHEVYLVLDHEKVVAGAEGTIGPDAQFVSADFLSHPSVNLYFSDDRRAVANINNPRLLNLNVMDTYDPSLTDPLPENTYALELRLGLNRALSSGEMYRVGYWAGDLRGMLDENQLFTESDGDPIPEPATLFLTAAGLAGLAAARRRRR